MFSAGNVNHPYEHLCGGRTVKEFTLDLFQIPDKVQAAMEAMMVYKREEARQTVRALGPAGYWVGSWRRRRSSCRRVCGTASSGRT